MKVLVFKDGNERLITGEEGKYWLIGEDRVRKLSAQISEVREVPEPIHIKLTAKTPADTGFAMATATTKKKPSAKKKKAAEAKDDGERNE